MKTILLLLTTLLSTDSTVIEQGGSTVPVADMDSYVYLLKPDKREGFITDKQQMEKNLITMLNVNIVNDYIEHSGLQDHQAFKNIESILSEMEVDLDDDFYIQLGLDKNLAHENVKSFLLKKEYFARMMKYLEYELENGKADGLLREYFLLNQNQWVKPEKRDLSVIVLDSQIYNQDQVKEILMNLISNDDFANFSKSASIYSKDPSVKSNKGHLKFFKETDLKYPFTDKIFSRTNLGVIPRVFKYKNDYYLVRINEIKDEIKPKFSDYKQEIADLLIPDLAQEQLQNIINAKAKNEVSINQEVLTHIFDRYNVLIEE